MLGVSKEKLLTDDVRAKLSIVEGLNEVTKLWVMYEQEKRTYHQMSSFHWKSSTILKGIDEVMSLVENFSKTMKVIASLQINQAILLTPAGSSQIMKKMDALTELAASLPMLKKQLLDTS